MQNYDQSGPVYSWPSQQCQQKAEITSAPARTTCFYALTLDIGNGLNKFLGIVRQSGWLYFHLGFVLVGKVLLFLVGMFVEILLISIFW